MLYEVITLAHVLGKNSGGTGNIVDILGGSGHGNLLLQPFMAEQTAEFRRMVLRERLLSVRAVAVFAKFLRLFLLHGHKPFVVLIMG